MKSLPQITCNRCYMSQNDRGQKKCLSCGKELPRPADEDEQLQLEIRLAQAGEYPG
jgi:hypothetical protein